MSASDALGSLAIIAVAAVAGYFGYKILSAKTSSGGNSWNLPGAASTLGSSSAAGYNQGQQYAASPAAWSGSAADVWTLAGNTQAVISRGIGAVLAPVTYSINSLGSWVGGWL